MSKELITTSAAGACFGAALAASGVYMPSIIISQMQAKNFHMISVFMAASASSALVLEVFDKMGWARKSLRSPSSLGLGQYSGNIIGGLMIGTGMTLTGACPGTVLVQLSSGVRSGWYVLAGGTLGGILYSQFGQYLPRNQACPAPTKLTVPGKLNVSSQSGVFVYELFCITLLAAVATLSPRRDSQLLNPLVGGSLIGMAQASSLFLTGNAVGVSTAYEVLGTNFWRIVDSMTGRKGAKYSVTSQRSLFFAMGIIAGSLTFHSLLPSALSIAGADISVTRGIVGGTVMVLGARIAGGCTSGHGITGMSTLSVASIVTVASMFIGGFGIALLV